MTGTTAASIPGIISAELGVRQAEWWQAYLERLEAAGASCEPFQQHWPPAAGARLRSSRALIMEDNKTDFGDTVESRRKFGAWPAFHRWRVATMS